MLHRQQINHDRSISAAELIRHSGLTLADDGTDFHHIFMVRAQISLNEEEYAAAKREAARLGISFAELVRRSLRTVLPVDDEKPWMRYAGMVETGDSDSSQHIDDVVCGGKD